MKTNTMKTNKSLLNFVSSSFALVVFASATAGAAVIATPQTGGNNAFTVSNTDTANASQGGSVSFSGTANFGSSAPKVIDGSIYNGVATNITDHTLSPSVGDTLTLYLAPSASGWDISSIVVLTGVGGSQSGRSDHSYTVALSTDGTSFGSQIINVNDTTTSSGEVQMTINDNGSALLGTGVKAVRFVFGNATGDAENMYREIDVLGVASVPEPSSLLLLGLSGLGLLIRRRC